jgi:hypothetical protein
MHARQTGLSYVLFVKFDNSFALLDLNTLWQKKENTLYNQAVRGFAPL